MKIEDMMNWIEDRWETFRETDAGFIVTLLPGWFWILIILAGSISLCNHMVPQ